MAGIINEPSCAYGKVTLVEGLPSGTVTFLFTDIVGSTRRWEEHGEDMAAALARHDVLLSSAIGNAGGTVFKHTGDGVVAVFRSAAAAVAAAVSAQQHLGSESWRGEPVAVRMGVHSGEAVWRCRTAVAPLRFATWISAQQSSHVPNKWPDADP